MLLAVAFLLQAATGATRQGRVQVEVTADSVPVAGAFVRSGRTGAITNPRGQAELSLPAGPQRIVVTAIGYRPDTATVQVVADSTVTLAVALEALTEELEEITVTSTRGERRIEDEPVRVEVLGGGDVAEKAQMRPADLTKLLTEMVGVRMQPGGGPLGPTRLRIQGLRGQYTGLLADGLPLFGGVSSGFSVLQLAPLDLVQAEVIKGAPTSLYGPSALGGLLNLVSRRPDRNAADLSLNQSDRGGSDLVIWGARRTSPTTGFTLTADGHRQTERDVDRDGWSDVPRYERVSLRPRLFVDRANGDRLFATLGLAGENRSGGFAPGLADPLAPYREQLETRRADFGSSLTRLDGSGGRINLRVAGMGQWTDQRFGTVRERNRRTTLFGEATYARGGRTVSGVGGAAWQQDRLRARDVPLFDYRFDVPAVFGQLNLDPAHWVAASVSGRCDFHNVYGDRCSPRASVLFRPLHDVTARLSAGTGFFGPTPFVDETEALGLHALVPSDLRVERARTASLDLGWHVGRLELSGTVAASRLLDPVAAVAAPGNQLRLINVTGRTDITAGELFAVYQGAPIVVTAFYGYLHGTEADPVTGRRRASALTPKHSLGLDVTWETPRTWIAVEAFYTGRQAVYDDPFRTSSRPYTITELLVSQRIRRTRVYFNVENVFDVRQTKIERIVLPSLGRGGRRTTAPWGNLEGRVASAGVLIGW